MGIQGLAWCSALFCGAFSRLALCSLSSSSLSASRCGRRRPQKNPLRRWGEPWPLGRKNSGLGPLQPGVTETELCPSFHEGRFREVGVSERDCRNSCFFGGRFSTSSGSRRSFRRSRWVKTLFSWAFEERFQSGGLEETFLRCIRVVAACRKPACLCRKILE